jgi:hypothetical protein
MDRRTFISGVTLGLVVSPLLAEAQQAGKDFTVGTLSLGFYDPAQPDWWQPFLVAMRA